MIRYGVKPGKVEEFIQPICDLKELATADDSDSIVLSYSVILRHFPKFDMDLLSPIIQNHPCLEDNDTRRDVLKQCTELYDVAMQQEANKKPSTKDNIIKRISKRAALGKSSKLLKTQSSDAGTIMAGVAALKWRRKAIGN